MTDKKYADEFLVEETKNPKTIDQTATTPSTQAQDQNLLYQGGEPQAKSPVPTNTDQLNTIKGNDGSNTNPVPDHLHGGSDFEQ